MKVGLVVGLLVGLACCPAWASLYEQASGFPNMGLNSSEFSNGGDVTGDVFICWDNFTLSQNASITSATWQGGYYNGTPNALSQFTVSFYADAGGTPNTAAPLQTAIITGNAGETSVGSDSIGNPIFNYSASFAGFNAVAGTQYWFSVKAYHNVLPQWGWQHAAAGAGDGFFEQSQSIGVPSSLARLEGDLTFSLDGVNGPSVVPEPITMVGLSSMLVMGYLANRRRLHARQ